MNKKKTLLIILILNIILLGESFIYLQFKQKILFLIMFIIPSLMIIMVIFDYLGITRHIFKKLSARKKDMFWKVLLIISLVLIAYESGVFVASVYILKNQHKFPSLSPSFNRIKHYFLFPAIMLNFENKHNQTHLFKFGVFCQKLMENIVKNKGLNGFPSLEAKINVYVILPYMLEKIVNQIHNVPPLTSMNRFILIKNDNFNELINAISEYKIDSFQALLLLIISVYASSIKLESANVTQTLLQFIKNKHEQYPFENMDYSSKLTKNQLNYYNLFISYLKYENPHFNNFINQNEVILLMGTLNQLWPDYEPKTYILHQIYRNML